MKKSLLSLLVAFAAQFVFAQDYTKATCAEVIAGEDGTLYEVTGWVSKVLNKTYGNWDLTDETGSIYVYGTLDAEGNKKNFASLGIEVGDTVTVRGPKKTYNATIELLDVTVVEIRKAQAAPAVITDATVAAFNAAEVGAAKLRVTGVIDEIGDATRGRFYFRDFSGRAYVYGASDFVASGAKVGDIVTLVGERGEYKGAAQMVNASFEKVQPVSEISIADFLALEDNKTAYYMVTGAISSIVNDTYGNLNLTDGTNTLYAYGCYPGYGATGDNRKNFLATANIEVGDSLTLIGYKTTYQGTPQIAGGIYFSHVKANATGVAEVQRDGASAVWHRAYDLSGRAVSSLRGLCVVDGKVVLVK